MELTSVLVLKVLDGLSARTKVISENIANANTPNYRPMHVTFEKALADAAAKSADAVQAVEPQVEFAPPGSPDSELRLDLELADASSTASRYASLIEILDRQGQLTSLAIMGGS